jgi:hypothetical protein
MRWVCCIFVCLLSCCGCARRSAGDWPENTSRPTTGAPSVIVTPNESKSGKIISVNPNARYVVITYPVGIALPPAERRLNVYRAGFKVGEVKVGKEQMDVNAVADILTGECQVGDEVREN